MTGKFKIIVPTEGINWIENPSFEVGVDNWNKTGSGAAIENSADYAAFGNYSLKLSSTSTGTYAIAYSNLSTHASQTAKSWHCEAWIYLNSSGILYGDKEIQLQLYDNGTTTLLASDSIFDPELNKWHKLELFAVSAVGASNMRLRVSVVEGFAYANNYIYIDGVKVDSGADGVNEIATTYLDGDQPGCYWAGEKHNSISIRRDNTRQNGLIYDLEDDLGLFVEYMQGGGYPGVKNVFRSAPKIDGGIYQNTRVDVPKLRLRGTIVEDSLENYHLSRRDLIDAISPRKDKEPVRIIYTGSDADKENYFHVSGGLQLAKTSGFAEQITVEMEAENPYWQAIITNSKAIYGSVVLTDSGAVQARGTNYSAWNNLGADSTYPNTFGGLNAIHYSKEYNLTILGGSWLDWNSISNTEGMVAWNHFDEAWEAVSGNSAIDGIINDIIDHPVTGLIAIGSWDEGVVGGTTVQICQWDGTDWSIHPAEDLLTWTPAHIYNGRDGNLYIDGRQYNYADDTLGWAWDTTTNFVVHSGIIVADDALGNFWVGGDITYNNGDGTYSHCVYKVNPQGEVEMLNYGVGGLYTSSSNVGDVHVLVPDNKGGCYVGGDLGGYPQEGIAYWNGLQWETMGGGTDSGTIVWDMKTINGKLWVVGDFREMAGKSLMTPMAIWNGSRWFEPALNTPTAIDFYLIEHATTDDSIFIGHDDVNASGTPNKGGYENSITVNGSVAVYPKLIFRVYNESDLDAPKRLLNIRNELTGKELFLDYSLAVGDKVTIDLEPGKQTSISSIYGVVNPIEPGSDIGEFYLEPGTQYVTAFIENNISDPSGEWRNFIVWRDKFWGLD